MTGTSLFELATRGKYRFPYKGRVSVEDLWDISLEGLDSIYKTLNSELKKIWEESLLETKSKEDIILNNKIDIVKYIVSVKLQEKDARERAIANKIKREKIMGILAEKQDQALYSASEEELRKMLEELGE